MTLEQLFQTAESRVYSFARNLWKDDPQARLREQAEQLSEEVRMGYAALGRGRVEEEAVRKRVADREAAAALLASRIETYLHVNDRDRAWKGALDLDALRGALQRDRAALSLHEEASRRRQAHLARLEERLVPLLEQLYPGQA